MVLVTHALQNKEPNRKIKLSENIWFFIEVPSVNKDTTFLLGTFKLKDYSVGFLQTVTCLDIIGFQYMTS